MVRLTVWLSDEQKDWVESQAESENIEQAEVIRRLIDNSRFGDSRSYSHSDSSSESVTTIASRVSELEDRLNELENRADEPQPTARERGVRMEGQRAEGDGGEQADGPSVASDPRPPDDAHSASEGTDDFGDVLSGVYDDMEFRETRREAGRAALEWLREQDRPQSAADFKDALLPEHEIEGQSPDTWWRKNAREALSVAVEEGLVEYREGYHDYRWASNS